MTIYKYSVRPVVIFALFSLILMSIAATANAKDAPDSTDIIQAALPDSISLSGKVVYVDFWASWCLPCRASFPWLQKLYERYHKDGLEVVAVGVDKDHKPAQKFLDEMKVSFPIVFDSTGTLAKEFNLKAMPMSFIYNRAGHLVSQELGFRLDKADSLDAAILKLLNERSTE